MRERNQKRTIMKRIIRTSICLTVMALLLICNYSLTAEAAQEPKEINHTHIFNQHYQQNAGYSEPATHDFVYGYTANNAPVIKQCYAVKVHAYYLIGCNCGVLLPGEPSHDHAYCVSHPLTKDEHDCKLKTVYLTIPNDCLY